MAAAGEGRRFGGDKQFRPLGGRRVIDWSVRGAARGVEGVVVVVPEHRVPEYEAWALSSPWATSGSEVELRVVAGGTTRSESVRCGLRCVPDEAEVVLVHDGARPLADDNLYRRVVAAVRHGADGAIPVVEISDTLRWRDGEWADRRELLAVQTPQGFRAGALREAHAESAEATDDATLVQAAGGTVVTVEGDIRNLKITEPHELAVVEALLGARDGSGGAGGGRD